MNVKYIHSTPEGERHIAYCARVSSPNQENPDYAKLLAYCIKHGHWSVFEQSSLNVEIITSRAIAQQILRHRSFHFQEFSQRYAKAQEYEIYEARSQDLKNRQNSNDDMSEEDKDWFRKAQNDLIDKADDLYNKALDRNIAKEQARFLLPLATRTKLYMHGTIRDWIHYCNVRCDPSTQKEHRDIAEACKKILVEHYPTVGKAMGWLNDSGSV